MALKLANFILPPEAAHNLCEYLASSSGTPFELVEVRLCMSACTLLRGVLVCLQVPNDESGPAESATLLFASGRADAAIMCCPALSRMKPEDAHVLACPVPSVSQFLPNEKCPLSLTRLSFGQVLAVL
jgi:hypothetical protein